MGKITEQQLEMFFEDVAPELIIEEDIMNTFDIHPDWNDLDVTYTVEYNDTMTTITLEEFDTVVAPSWIGISEAEKRDWIMWEETKPLTSTTEADMLRKEIRELNETLYTQYKRVAELTEEVNELKVRLEQKLHTNTRTF
jgi:hypothetical protein